MSKSLMILGGSGFFGKSFLDAYLQKKLDKFKISKLILISYKSFTISDQYSLIPKVSKAKVSKCGLI
jgi:dTDP-D-glucose 4,6-dehydratase